MAERLAALPALPPIVLPPRALAAGHEDADALLAADLAALGYTGFDRRDTRHPRNPAETVLAVIARRQVSPGVMAAVPWVLLTYPHLDAAWLVDQARRRNLQNRLGFLTDLALELARLRLTTRETSRDEGRARAENTDDTVDALEALRAQLETSRLANPDTLARVLTPAEQQFFEAHRGPAARHWNLLTGLTVAQLPYR